MALKSKLNIETAFVNGRTILKNSYCNPPFKIADVTEDKTQPVLSLMLMSSSPGVLDDDAYFFEINISDNCSLHLTTQSYQRLFQMKTGAAQTMHITVGTGASLIYLPHPLVPHENSVFCSRNTIQLSDAASLIWGEVTSCGRKLNGEIFRFSSYHSRTDIYKGGRLSVKENLIMKPAQIDPFTLGQMEGYTHQATLIFINETANISELSKELHKHIDIQEDITFGVTALPVKGILVRLLGYSAEHLFSLVKQVAVYCESSKYQPELKTIVHVV